jgi:hypothetical protein
VTFLNATDYPDFTALGQSGNGIIFSNANLAAGTYGPFYVGNLPAIAVSCLPEPGSNLVVTQQDTPVFGGFNWGSSSYSFTDITEMYDEIKVAAPYLYLVYTGATGSVLQITQSQGSKGIPAFNNSNYIYQATALNIAANAHVTAMTAVILPGPAFCTAIGQTGGVPMVRINDSLSGVITGPLGFGVGPASVNGTSGVTFPFCASNNSMQVVLFNNGAADANMEIAIISTRGY